jgi:hypothetical protein
MNQRPQHFERVGFRQRVEAQVAPRGDFVEDLPAAQRRSGSAVPTIAAFGPVQIYIIEGYGLSRIVFLGWPCRAGGPVLAKNPLKPGAYQGQIGHAGRQQRDGQRHMYSLAGGSENRSHGGRKHRAILAGESRTIFFAGFRTRLRLSISCQRPPVSSDRRRKAADPEVQPGPAIGVRFFCGAHRCPMRYFAMTPS